jgi:hypothetical protein
MAKVTQLYEYRHKVRRIFPRAAAAAFYPILSLLPPLLMPSMNARTATAGGQQPAAVPYREGGGFVPPLGVGFLCDPVDVAPVMCGERRKGEDGRVCPRAGKRLDFTAGKRGTGRGLGVISTETDDV